MPIYFVNDNPQNDGYHEVHRDDCSWLSLVVSKTPLGYHINCQSAVIKAKETYPKSDGCKYCSPNCHTR